MERKGQKKENCGVRKINYICSLNEGAIMRGITNTSQIYQYTPISKDEGLSMRGIAILCIIFHNFLHLTLHTVENEFTFLEHRAHVFTHCIANNPSWLLADIMSFLGWYGVPIFLFLSGYGLVRKFEGAGVGGGGKICLQ